MSDKEGFVGSVESVLGNNNYVVLVTIGGVERKVRCHLNGKMRLNRITVIPGDSVQLEIPPPYDLGRITRRLP